MTRGHLRIRGWLLLLLLVGLGLLPGRGYTATWQEKKSTHFQVFYVTDAAFASLVIQRAEQYYDRLVIDLGFRHVVKRDRVPWLWENRCQIYLYPDRLAYLQGTGAPQWSAGFVNYRQRKVYSFNGAHTFLDTTLPHELTHILFREYVGFENPLVPRWLDEGIAEYSEAGAVEQALERMQSWLKQGVYIPMNQLMPLRVGHAQRVSARVFYTQAVTLVEFFLSAYGSRRFIDLCSSLRDGYDLERALSFATAGSLQSVADLEAAWAAFLLSLP